MSKKDKSAGQNRKPRGGAAPKVKRGQTVQSTGQGVGQATRQVHPKE
jgi:hypothetical protein